MSMLNTGLKVWLILILWAIVTAVFLVKLDKRKLAILVIILSLLVLAYLVFGLIPAITGGPHFVSSPHVTTTG